MDITRRLVGCAAILENGEVGGIDLNAIIRRLILFDTYIFKSIRLREVPSLVRQLGFENTIRLLQSPAIEIECESLSVGQTGQLAILESRAKKGLLPLLSYSLAGVNTADHKKYLHDCLQGLHEIGGLGQKRAIKLKRAIAQKVVRLPDDIAGRVATQATADVLNKQHLVRRSVGMTFQRMMNAAAPEFSISIHAIDEEDIRVETDLTQRLNVEVVHKIVEGGLLAVGGLSCRFAEMHAYSALSGFSENDLPLIDEQLKFLLCGMSPDAKEEQLRRVVELAGFPNFADNISDKPINVERLLEIRESAECREFREWLPTIENASDAEIRDRIGSLRARLGNAVQSRSGKVVRFLTTTGIGSIPTIGPIAGAAAGFIDTFLLERLLPKSGIVAFISDQYPSIFETRKT
jgi:hypothetical protein